MPKTGLYNTKLLTVCFIIFSFPLIALVSCRTLTDKKPDMSDTYQSNPEEDRRLDWFREAKFGMFIHWGPYSQLAGEKREI